MIADIRKAASGDAARVFAYSIVTVYLANCLFLAWKAAGTARALDAVLCAAGIAGAAFLLLKGEGRAKSVLRGVFFGCFIFECLLTPSMRAYGSFGGFDVIALFFCFAFGLSAVFLDGKRENTEG